MNRKRRRSSGKKIVLIIVLLILCVLASLYIVNLVNKSREARQEEARAAEEAAAQAEQEAEQAEANAEAEMKSGAASHIYSHKGSAGDDELTMPAYEKASEAGSVFLEADMVVSAEGTPYIAHDDYAKDMTGYDGYFSGMTDAQIDGIKTRSGNEILKLSDLFEKYGDSVTYIIDLKYPGERNITAFTDIIKKYGYEKNVIAASFYPNALSPLEETFPDMTKMFLCSDQGTFNAALDYSYTDILCVPKEILTEDNLKAAHDKDKKFSAWTLNTEEEIKSAIELGADSYFTDDTALAIRLEEENRQE